ncbi:membrane lipoprotein [Vibrio phage 1.063.O._10N.261.45.C7]|nr:membrane lipoprotein [Vibrio phage 1.063.O._10N.261.45.C7]
MKKLLTLLSIGVLVGCKPAPELVQAKYTILVGSSMVATIQCTDEYRVEDKFIHFTDERTQVNYKVPFHSLHSIEEGCTYRKEKGV